MEGTGEAHFEIGRLYFDPRSGELRTRSASRRLEPRAAAVLAVLCGAGGDVVSRQELLDRCWGESEGSDEALTQAVAQIRRALEELGEGASRVETLAKRGYRLRRTAAEASETIMAAPEDAPKTSRRRLARLLTIGAFAALALLWIAFPHGPRHWVRHAFGLAAPAYGQHHPH